MGTILLVDDDPLQAALRLAALQKQFSGVERVTNPAEALCLVEQPQFAANLGLVISSLHAAGFGGPEFVAELRARMPALRILVIGSGTDSPRDYLWPGVCFCLRPTPNEELVRLAGQMVVSRLPKAAEAAASGVFAGTQVRVELT